MNENALIGRCGVYCGACCIYRAYKDGGDYLQQLGKFMDLAPDKIRCNGCQALTPDCDAYSCTIRLCLDSRGHQYCYECSEYKSYTCSKFEKVAIKWDKDGIDLIENLELIRAGKIEELNKINEEKFRCKNCGKPLPALRFIFDKKCYHCGAELTK